MPNLLPCPFCGSPGEYDSQRAERITGFHTSTGHAVYCSSMECEASVGIHETVEEAIAAWNRRA